MEARHDMRYNTIMVDNTMHLGMDVKNFNVIQRRHGYKRSHFIFCSYIYRGQPERDSKYI
jgi:hypothetical protein